MPTAYLEPTLSGGEATETPADTLGAAERSSDLTMCLVPYSTDEVEWQPQGEYALA